MARQRDLDAVLKLRGSLLEDAFERSAAEHRERYAPAELLRN
jgi:hypothetical protein